MTNIMGFASPAQILHHQTAGTLTGHAAVRQRLGRLFECGDLLFQLPDVTILRMTIGDLPVTELATAELIHPIAITLGETNDGR
jgi:hypothetical protein